MMTLQEAKATLSFADQAGVEAAVDLARRMSGAAVESEFWTLLAKQLREALPECAPAETDAMVSAIATLVCHRSDSHGTAH